MSFLFTISPLPPHPTTFSLFWIVTWNQDDEPLFNPRNMNVASLTMRRTNKFFTKVFFFLIPHQVEKIFYGKEIQTKKKKNSLDTYITCIEEYHSNSSAQKISSNN